MRQIWRRLEVAMICHFCHLCCFSKRPNTVLILCGLLADTMFWSHAFSCFLSCIQNQFSARCYTAQAFPETMAIYQQRSLHICQRWSLHLWWYATTVRRTARVLWWCNEVPAADRWLPWTAALELDISWRSVRITCEVSSSGRHASWPMDGKGNLFTEDTVYMFQD